nr:hypothetical protein [Salinibacter sp.]
MMRMFSRRPKKSAFRPRSHAATRPLYRNSTNSTSVMTPLRRQRRAKKKTVSIPPMAAFHQSQLPAMPFWATISVTSSGVSTANVVATMLVPASHQGIARPDRKNSEVSSPARW